MRYYMLNLPWYPHMLTKGELGVINYVILLHMLTTTNLDTQHSKLYFHSIIISWQPTTHNTHTHLILPCPLPAKVLPLSLHVAVYIYIYIRVDIYIYYFCTNCVSFYWVNKPQIKVTDFLAAIPHKRPALHFHVLIYSVNVFLMWGLQ